MILPKLGSPMYGSGLGQYAQQYAGLLGVPKTPFTYNPPPIRSPIAPSPAMSSPFVSSTPQHSPFYDGSGSADASNGISANNAGPMGAFGPQVGENPGHAVASTVANMGLGLTGQAIGLATGRDLGKDVAEALGFTSLSTDVNNQTAENSPMGLSAVAAAMAAADNQAAENDAANGGVGGDGPGASGAASGGNESGEAAGGDGTGGSAGTGDGWKNGGSIRNVRGLLDDPKKQSPNSKTMRGLLSGAGTGTSDSIPAVNVKTGEKIKVSTGEYVIPAKVVKAKGKKFFDALLKQYGG